MLLFAIKTSPLFCNFCKTERMLYKLQKNGIKLGSELAGAAGSFADIKYLENFIAINI